MIVVVRANFVAELMCQHFYRVNPRFMQLFCFAIDNVKVMQLFVFREVNVLAFAKKMEKPCCPGFLSTNAEQHLNIVRELFVFHETSFCMFHACMLYL